VTTARGSQRGRPFWRSEQRRAVGALAAVRGALLAEGGLLASALGGVPSEGGALGDRAAAGPRSAGREGDVAFVVEAIREGELLHYGTPRLFEGIEPDLALLAGDRLYALGLARLAQLGDLEAISLCAQARAEERPELASAVWQAGVAAVGWGSSDAMRAAKAAARAGEPDAYAALLGAARQLTGDLAPAR
jgi:hypothetical protein